MSEQPRTVAIGAFVIGAILIGVTIVIFTLGSGFGQKREKAVMVFDGSVKGLVIGAPVTLRGVQIGQVTKLELMLDADAIELIMVVEAEISESNIRRLGNNPETVADELIARGLRAQLRTQSLLTGLLYVQLDFHPDKPPVFVDLQTDHLQIPTIPTELEMLTQKLEEIDLSKLAERVESIVTGLEHFLADEDFQAMPANLQSTLNSVTALTDELRVQVTLAGPKVDELLEEANETIAEANQELPALYGLVNKNLNAMDAAISSFQLVMSDVDGVLGPESSTTYQLNEALKELGLASRAMRELANTLNEQPESLLRGKRENTQ
ncbi:MAG: MlaD family protein [Pseudomonadota bacterium]